MIIYIVHNLDSHTQSAHTDGCEAEKAAQALEAEGVRVKVFRHRVETEARTELKTESKKTEKKQTQTVTAIQKTTSKKKKTEKRDFMDRWLDFYAKQRSTR